MKILIVDDDEMVAFLLKTFLEQYGETTVAANGALAVQAVEQSWEENSPFDLICLDIMMPEMNGLEALKAIREKERERSEDVNQRIKIVMVSALDDEQTIEDAHQFGCDGYLTKENVQSNLPEMLSKLGLLE